MNLLKEKYPEIFSEIDVEKTKLEYPHIDLDKLSYGSHIKVYFKCKACGYSYLQEIKSRTISEHGCPVCSGKIVIKGINDFETWCKRNKKDYILKYWDYENNSKLPSEISYSSAYRAKFKCNLGHSFEKIIFNIFDWDGSCPVCNNKELLTGFNDLQTKYPRIAKEFDIDKNGITPDKVLFNSSKKYWFKCQNNHEYLQQVNNRTLHGYSCRICKNLKVLTGYNDLKTKYPNIAKEWDYAKNYPILPENVLFNSYSKYYFICPKCGSSYQTHVNSRTLQNTGCPYCCIPRKKTKYGLNDLETFCKNNPEYQYILDEWNYKKNKDNPKNISPFTHKKYWFICKNGHHYEQGLNSKIRYKQGCPLCNPKKSVPELSFYELCKKYVDNSAISGSKINNWEIDIFLPSLKYCIEYDGKRYHNSDISKDREIRKNKSILSSNYAMIRIKETDNLKDFKKFKEIKNGVIIYYINSDQRNKYFKRFSGIFKDLFKKSIEISEIKEVFNNIKNNLRNS